MSDESEPVATTRSNLLTFRSALSTTTLWLQRALLTTLTLAHLSVPFLFALGHQGDLIRDVALDGQLSLLLISLTLLGLRWPGIILLLIGGVLHFGVWFVIYAEAAQSYVYDALALPAVVLTISLVGLRLWGWQGIWNVNPAGTTPPWQVSIRQLLIVTTAIAVAFAGGSWLRQFPGLETSLYWLVVTADGLGSAALCLTAVWAFGTQGSAVLKFGALLLVATALAACQIFAFRMEEFWHLSTIISLAYSLLLAGTLAIWRLCGWRIVKCQPLSPKTL